MRLGWVFDESWMSLLWVVWVLNKLLNDLWEKGTGPCRDRKLKIEKKFEKILRKEVFQLIDFILIYRTGWLWQRSYPLCCHRCQPCHEIVYWWRLEPPRGQILSSKKMCSATWWEICQCRFPIGCKRVQMQTRGALQHTHRRLTIAQRCVLPVSFPVDLLLWQ